MDGTSATSTMRNGSSGGEIALARLRARFGSAVLAPGEEGYDTARKVWNGRIDKWPAAIANCGSADDVVAALGVARAERLEIAVRSGGHSLAGASVSDGGLVIDLSRMKAIEVDPVRRCARVGAGATLGEFDEATGKFGLATTLGVNSDTGIAGLTLGGGLGRLGRKYGLACDNLSAAEIVLADGRVVTASESDNPDLFWAIRGGGGNFGIVTHFTYRLHPCGPQILGGLLLYEFSRAPDMLRFYRDFANAAGDAVSADAILLTASEGQRMLALSVCYLGSLKQGERALRTLRSFGPPVEDLIRPVAYPALQASADPLFVRGRRYYWKGHFLNELSDDAIDALTEGYARTTSPLSVVVLQQAGGAISRVPTEATAYFNRNAAFDFVPVAIWEDPAEDAAHVAWARQFSDAMRPFSNGSAYVNTLGDEGGERVRAAYGTNFPRLAAVKAKYDPDNVFRLNQNIKPAG